MGRADRAELSIAAPRDRIYDELVPGERVVQRVVFDAEDPAFAGTMTMTWSLLEAPNGTVVEIRADDVPSGISASDHAVGLASSLDNLSAYVAVTPPPVR